MSPVYVVLHADPAFTGFWAGLDFYQGRGSTSVPQDVIRLVQNGCRLPDEAQRAEIRTLALAEARRRRAKLAEIKKGQEFERTPAYTESVLRRKAEREEAEARRKKEDRPRRRFHR